MPSIRQRIDETYRTWAVSLISLRGMVWRLTIHSNLFFIAVESDFRITWPDFLK